MWNLDSCPSSANANREEEPCLIQLNRLSVYNTTNLDAIHKSFGSTESWQPVSIATLVVIDENAGRDVHDGG